MKPYFNPYSDETFFGFFAQLVIRFWAFLTGNLPMGEFVSDEIQIIVLVGVAVSSAVLGCFLILRRMAMLANSLSHTILLGIVIAYVTTVGTVHEITGQHDPINITAMLWASLLMGLITTFLTEFLNKTIGLQEDASIGIVFSSLFALGIILVTILTRSAHIGTEVVMGNVDALQFADCKLVYIVLAINIVTILLFYKEFKITTFDQGLSRTLGISPGLYNYLLMTLVSATSIAAFRAVGVLMVLSFITGPALAARLLTHQLKTMILLAAGFGILASVAGVALSRHLLTMYDMPLSTGGLVVCTIVFIFVLALGWSKLQVKIAGRAKPATAGS
jgi:manganese/zinc/iron transport system permease protein